MRMKRYALSSAALFVFAMLSTSLVFAGGDIVVIDEDFESGTIDGELINNAIIVDAVDGPATNVLSLTQGANSQSGFAWFNEPFNLRDNKVEIEFDFYLRTGVSQDPADGMSVIFQFGSDPFATGGGGGGLGTSAFPSDYVSVAFDIWDNGVNDPESACDAGNRTCHIEVNQNINPGGDPSLATNVDVPDFIAVGDTLEPIRARILFDLGLIAVWLTPPGGVEASVIRVPLADFPEVADALVGFAASTGGANAHHEVDNLLVTIGEPTVRVREDVRLGDGNSGGINCGGNVEVTGDVGGTAVTFVPDVAFGGFIQEVPGDGKVTDQFAAYGNVGAGNAAGPGDVVIADSGDLDMMYRTERWLNGPVSYEFSVNPGRYEVNLHFAEICVPCATRTVHATIGDERALSFYSTRVEADVLTANVKTFEVDAGDILRVVISDTGLITNPPENAQINGISYRRVGDATGAALSGAEDNSPEDLPNLDSRVVVEESFDDDELPEGWLVTTTSVDATSGIVVNLSDAHLLGIDNRLRLTDNATGVATAVVIDEPVDLSKRGFEAEFTVHLTRDVLNGNPPADGMTFFFLPGDEVPLDAIGASGGALGYSGISEQGFAIEFDFWQGGGDPNGFNTGPRGHVGLVANGDVTLHVQTSSALGGSRFESSNWPISLITDTESLDFGQFVANTFDLESEEKAGIRCEVQLNNGRMRVWISTVNDDSDIGFVYPRTLVIDTLVENGITGLGPGFFGFSAGTGGAVTWHEIDDVEIREVLNQAVSISRSVNPSIFSGPDDDIAVSIAVTVEPDTGSHDVEIAETLPLNFSAIGISDGGAMADGQVTWSVSVSESTTLTYTLNSDDLTKSDVQLTGAYDTAGISFNIEATTLTYAPAPFCFEDTLVEIFNDFEDETGCPDGWTCQNNTAPLAPYLGPGVGIDGHSESRLQLTDLTGSLSTAAFYNTPIDLSSNAMTVRFSYLMERLDGGGIADGFTFAMLDAEVSGPGSLGVAGGGIGYSSLTGLAIEFDTWVGPGDPAGAGYNQGGYGHVGLVANGDVVNHIQTNIDLDPNLIPETAGGTGWPAMVDIIDDGFESWVDVRIEYNNGNVKVFMAQADDGVGVEFPETLVLDSSVTFPTTELGVEPTLQSAIIGFTAGTGGAQAYHEIDDLSVVTHAAIPCSFGGGFIRGDADASGAINITDGIFILNFLFLGGEDPSCKDAADADDSNAINITDGIYVLNFLFLGGPNPKAPYPACGPDPDNDEAVDCAMSHEACL